MAHTSPKQTKGTLTARTGASRGLLVKKAIERLRIADQGEGIEAVFPTPASRMTDVAASIPPATSPSGGPILTIQEHEIASLNDSTRCVPAAPDEAAAAQLLFVPGKSSHTTSVTSTIITMGNIKPNAGTVFAVIAGIVGERGTISRADLIAAMASTPFPQVKARPEDRGWCQGYVAGAIRSGFLAIARPLSTTELPTTGEEA